MLARVKASAPRLTPLVKHEFSAPGSTVRFSAACFGGEDKEWSLGPLQNPEDVKKHPVLVAKIRDAMQCLGADRAYAPNPVAFNAAIVHPTELSKVLLLGKGMVLFRNKERLADGTLLRSPGDVGVFSAAGCSVIAMTIDGRLLFAHAGRDCVINRKRVLGKPDARAHESIVDALVDELFELGFRRGDLARLHVWSLYSIKPEDFLHRYDDATHALYNQRVAPHLEQQGLKNGYRKTSEGVELDIPAIVKGQFLRHGVPERNIHLEHCYLADELPTTRNGGGRYLVAIARTA